MKRPELKAHRILGFAVLVYIPVWVWRLTGRMVLRIFISKDFIAASWTVSSYILHRELKALEGHLLECKDVMSVLSELHTADFPHIRKCVIVS